MKSVLARSLGVVLLFVLASCAGQGTTPPAAFEPDSAPTNLPPALSRISSESLPEICDCVLRFDHIGIEQGLSQSSVRAIFQDSRGFMWFGTEDGLNRYDGYTFKTFKPDPDVANSLSDRWITSLVEDQEGYLWIGTRLGGLNRYDPRTEDFKVYLHANLNPSSLSDNHINILYLDRDNNLWVGTQTGLDLLDRTSDTFKHYIYNPSRPEGITGKNITALYQDNQGRFWVGTTAGGLFRFNAEKNSYIAYQNNPDNPNSISHSNVTAITEDKNGILWIGTRNGLNRFDPETTQFVGYMHDDTDTSSLSANMVNVLYVDVTGNLWVGTSGGLDRLKPTGEGFVRYRHDPTFLKSLSDDSILSIHEDRGGVLWFGTSGGGVNKYDRNRDNFSYYRHDPGDPNTLSGNLVTAIYADQEGYAWMGTMGDGMDRFNWFTGEVIHYQNDPRKPNSIGSDEILSITQDLDGILWIGTTNGLERFNQKTFTFRHYRRDASDPDSLSANMVYSVYVDTQNELWVGTLSGLDRFDRKSNSFIHYRPEANNSAALSGGIVNIIYEDNEGALWIGTAESGLNRFDRETETFIRYRYSSTNKMSISSDSILSIYQDAKGHLWVGTAGGGLNLFHPDSNSFTYYLEKDGLPNGVVHGIIEDSDGNLWMSTNLGITRFNPETETFRNFDASDGLQSNEFNSLSYARGRNGEFYFGGIEGLTVFDPSHIMDNPYAPQVTLTSLTQDDQPIVVHSSVETADTVILRWPQNSLEFEFAGLSYNQPNKNEYAYMLEGFDPNWHFIETQRNGRYTNLPGGDYTLLLKATNSDGVWSETPVRISVKVVPPFWETIWFRVLISIGIVGVILGGIRLRTRTIQERNRQLERLVQERTFALEKRGLEMEALYQADEKILRNVSLNQVFQTLVDVAVDMLHADRSIVFAWDEKKKKLIPRISRNFSAETLKVMEFEEGEGTLGNVLTTGQNAVVRQIDLNEFRDDVRAALIAEGIRSFVHIPIAVDNKIVGVFNVGFTKPNLLGDDTMRLFSALTHRASISIANMELFEQTKDLAVMEERNRLARDLHDSAKQKAFAALAQLGTARGILNGNGNTASLHLSEAENLVSDVIQELTFLIQEIYPIALQEKGLVTSLREYIFEWENRNDISVQFSSRYQWGLPLEVEQAIYRVSQEMLANIARHSRASRVEISLVYDGNAVQLSVCDNGCGFDTNSKSHGMGLRSIRERVGSIHGTLQIESAPDHGTRLLVQVPTKSERGSNGK